MKNGYFLALLLLTLFYGCSKNSSTQPDNVSLTGTWKLQTAIASTYNKSGVLKAQDTVFKPKTNQDSFIAFTADGMFEEYILNNTVKINSQKGTYLFDAGTHSLTETLAISNNNPVNNTPGQVRGSSSGNSDVLLSKVKFINGGQINIVYTYYILNYEPYSGGVSTVITDSVVQINTLIKQ